MAIISTDRREVLVYYRKLSGSVERILLREINTLRDTDTGISTERIVSAVDFTYDHSEMSGVYEVFVEDADDPA